jgi:hypothetical protein
VSRYTASTEVAEDKDVEKVGGQAGKASTDGEAAGNKVRSKKESPEVPQPEVNPETETRGQSINCHAKSEAIACAGRVQ